MKTIEIAPVDNIVIKPFILEDFIEREDTFMYSEKISKKELKALANNMGLEYDDKSIALAKKLLNAYLKEK